MPENLIDYMSVILYGGNLDAPISNFIQQNHGINNWFGIRNRNGDQGFQFFVHDSEHTMLDVNTNRNGPFPAGDMADHANPQWIHQQLMFCDEYRLHVRRPHAATDVQRRRADAGRQPARLNARAAEIDMAIIAESARWGDSKREPPLHENQLANGGERLDYLDQRAHADCSESVPRHDVVQQWQLWASAPLYPSLNAQTPISQNGGNFAGGFKLSNFRSQFRRPHLLHAQWRRSTRRRRQHRRDGESLFYPDRASVRHGTREGALSQRQRRMERTL